MQPTNIKPSAEDISKISQIRSQLNEDLGGPGGKPGGGRHQEQGWKNFEKLSKEARWLPISEKCTQNQLITRSFETFSNPACLMKRRTVSMRRRRSISEVVLPRKSIHIFGLFS